MFVVGCFFFSCFYAVGWLLVVGCCLLGDN